MREPASVSPVYSIREKFLNFSRFSKVEVPSPILIKQNQKGALIVKTAVDYDCSDVL